MSTLTETIRILLVKYHKLLSGKSATVIIVKYVFILVCTESLAGVAKDKVINIDMIKILPQIVSTLSADSIQEFSFFLYSQYEIYA